MATPLSIEIEISIWEIVMTINPERKTEFRSVWIKTAEHQLFHELETEYGFPRATCRSLVQLMQEFIEENYGNLRGDNQIIYHDVSKDEPPGKQLDKIKIVSVKLTLSHPEDAEILEKKGIHVLRQHKMMRFATEAYDQGGLLVQEDLALLLNSGRRTIQRDIAYLKKQEIIIPTRGSIQDIGPTISHKTNIVEFYLKGYEYTEIERRTRHTGQSIKRYIIGFSKVVMLQSKGYTVSYSPGCYGRINNNEAKTCVVINDDIAPHLKVIKHVVNDNEGTAKASDFTIYVWGDNPSPESFTGSEEGTTVAIYAGDYGVYEYDWNPDYDASYSPNCNGYIEGGEIKTCTITNDDIPSPPN